MPVITEEFKPFIFSDPITNKVDFIYQPKITIFIKIQNNLYPYPLEAYVDSGATRNLFPSDPLEYFNIKLNNGKKKIHYGIGGAEVISYSHEVEILFNKIKINTEIDFSKKHKAPLLGVEKFFSHFQSVHFNMRLKQLELNYNPKVYN